MLVKDFYYIDGKQIQDDGSLIYSVSLNPGHEVYKGHFPEKPITPGVCSIQMIKELAEDCLSKKLTLSCIDRCRLTAMITPDSVPEFSVRIAIDPADNSKISAEIFSGSTTYLTLAGTLIDRLQ